MKAGRSKTKRERRGGMWAWKQEGTSGPAQTKEKEGEEEKRSGLGWRETMKRTKKRDRPGSCRWAAK